MEKTVKEKTMKSLSLVIFIILISQFSSLVQAQDKAAGTTDIRYLHVMMGTLDAEDSWTITDDEGGDSSADRGDLPYAGIAAQLSNGNGKFQYGFESGGLISFKNDTSYFIQSNGGLNARIKVDNQLWMLDMSLGGFVSVRPWRWFRVYASAGPSVVLGSIEIGEDDVSAEGADEPEFSPSKRESDIDVGFYGRAGFDIILNNGFVLGVSARQVDTKMDFGNSGVLELDSTQYFLTLGQAF